MGLRNITNEDKGHRQTPTSRIPSKEYKENYDKIFGKGKKKEESRLPKQRDK